MKNSLYNLYLLYIYEELILYNLYILYIYIYLLYIEHRVFITTVQSLFQIYYLKSVMSSTMGVEDVISTRTNLS